MSRIKQVNINSAAVQLHDRKINFYIDNPWLRLCWLNSQWLQLMPV